MNQENDLVWSTTVYSEHGLIWSPPYSGKSEPILLANKATVNQKRDLAQSIVIQDSSQCVGIHFIFVPPTFLSSWYDFNLILCDTHRVFHKANILVFYYTFV